MSDINQHHVAKAFWDTWEENGETHKHGFYESTWMALRAAMDASGITAENESLRSRLSGMEKDAERYRWLQQRRADGLGYTNDEVALITDWALSLDTPEKIDAAIDAALPAPSKGEV